MAAIKDTFTKSVYVVAHKCYAFVSMLHKWNIEMTTEIEIEVEIEREK